MSDKPIVLLDVDGVLNACRVPDDMPGEYNARVCNGWNPALGLPVDLTVVASPHQQHKCLRGEWWKLEYAQATYDQGRKVVWLDDDIRYDNRATDWIRTADQERLLALSPDTEEGLTEGHLDLIEAFLR